MRPILQGESGAAVEDIQQRLLSLGYHIGQEGIDALFGKDTAQAVSEFRQAHGLSTEAVVDKECWNLLVDETFVLGDRSLYLRYPNFHGNDVKTLQRALNILGFVCGPVDGIYGVRTEGAVKEFQGNVGLNPDGIAFQDTFHAVNRLHHVWADKTPSTHESEHTTLARTAEVIESVSMGLIGQDPIARNVAGRIWNIATATSELSQITLLTSQFDREQALAGNLKDPQTAVDDDKTAPTHFDYLIELAVNPEQETGVARVRIGDFSTLATRIMTACAAYRASQLEEGTNKHQKPSGPVHLVIELDGVSAHDGSFTSRKAQHIAISLLDAFCVAFGGNA